jgi:gluconate kinase
VLLVGVVVVLGDGILRSCVEDTCNFIFLALHFQTLLRGIKENSKFFMPTVLIIT